MQHTIDIHRTESRRLLEATTLAGLRLRNRIVVAPMSRVSATRDGAATERMAQYYAEFAKGGFGLVITEGIYPDSACAQGYAQQPGLVTREHVRSWRAVTSAVHRARGTIFAQLMHAGALSQCLGETLAPSAVQPLGEKMREYGGVGPFTTPSAMSHGEIEDAIQGFARSARRAVEAGFDGIEIHAANGYLIDQFLTAYTNHRQDVYGGDVAGRIRFAVDVLVRARAAVRDEIPVGIRLSQTKVNDHAYRWPGGQRDAEVIFGAVRDGGAGYVHLASEGRDWWETARLEPNGVTITELARSITGVAVIANGGMHDADLAEAIVARGQADLVSLGRGALANPDWPDRLADGGRVRAFDRRMIHPSASLEHADAWCGSLPGAHEMPCAT